MSPLERKKIEVELSQVESGKASMELKIMEREEEIERIKSQIEIQDARAEELKKQLKENK